MALHTHESLEASELAELMRKVRDIETSTDCKGPCPDAKAEAHEQAKALGIVLGMVPDDGSGESMAPRSRLHPMA